MLYRSLTNEFYTGTGPNLVSIISLEEMKSPSDISINQFSLLQVTNDHNGIHYVALHVH